jgi:nucleotide-binding universal stress UspA family protein
MRKNSRAVETDRINPLINGGTHVALARAAKEGGFMPANKTFAGVQHIFCPTDLTARSQQTLAFAAQLAAASGARLTAFHAAPDTWFRPSSSDVLEGKGSVEKQILNCVSTYANDLDLEIIVEKGPDPAAEIVRLVRELDVDLVVMKARPGVSSALHFGSIVERVISGSRCPVLLLPAAFLRETDPAFDKLNFKRILFDYDFSQATDDLFHLTNDLIRDHDSSLNVISVLEPPPAYGVDLDQLETSKLQLGTAIKNRLSNAVLHEGRSPADISTRVEWGSHTDTILNYARDREIDLICTALSAPDRFVEKFYKLYLGQLLASSTCPILVKQCV